MVIPGISSACFATSSFPLIPMCAGTLHRAICFPGNGALLVCHISDLILDGLLCCSQRQALNSASLYILQHISIISFVNSTRSLLYIVIH